MKKAIFIITLILSIFIFLNTDKQSLAQEKVSEQEGIDLQEVVPNEDTKYVEPEKNSMKGKILEVSQKQQQELYGQMREFQNIKVKITSGVKKGETIDVLHAIPQLEEAPEYTVGNKVYILQTKSTDGKDVYYITDFDRTGNIILLFAFFALMVILVSRWWGVSSLVGMLYTFVIIFKFLLPKISEGGNPILIAVAAATMIAPVTFYLAHGFNKKTTTALIGTIISLALTAFLATIFIGLAKLTGYGSEEALFLQVATGGSVNIKGLLLAGIIIGSLGILDDVTITQTSLVSQLKKANKDLDATKIFHMAMDVGHDHIASTVNTLVLVYTGAAMPLLLLFINNPITTTELINSEIMAEEIVRTLVSSIGLVLSIPITTLIASIDKKEDIKATVR